LAEAQRLHEEARRAVTTLFESGLQACFSERNTVEWPIYRADLLFSTVSGQVDPRDSPYLDMPHIGPDCIEPGTGRLLHDTIQTPIQLGLKSGKYLFGPAHVLYSKIRPALRKVALPSFAGVCSADMYPLLPNTDLLSREFLALSLLSPAFSRYAAENSDRNAMPKINRSVLFAYEMPVPDKDTQEQIVKELFELKEKAERLSEVQAEMSAELDSLTPALLDKAFRGEL
jgi:type I restriction enzyme S subunit